MSSSLSTLPEGYTLHSRVNLQQNKKLALAVNLAAVLMAVALCVPLHRKVSITTLFDLSDGLLLYLLRFAVLIVGQAVYMVLHELVHGVTMKAFGTKKIKYGFTGLYAFAGSDDYYRKRPYLTIALAPVVTFALLLGGLCAVVPTSWLWVAYLLFVSNLSGAAGDLYMTIKLLPMNRAVLIRDYGVHMELYTPEGD